MVQKIGINIVDYQVIISLMRQVFIEISPYHKILKWFIDFQEHVERVGFQPLTIRGLSDIRWLYHYRCTYVLKA